MATFSNNTESNDYAGIQLEVKVNGKYVNLGSLFVTNKGSSKISKQLYSLIEEGKLDPAIVDIKVNGIFSSEDSKDSDLEASAFE